VRQQSISISPLPLAGKQFGLRPSSKSRAEKTIRRPRNRSHRKRYDQSPLQSQRQLVGDRKRGCRFPLIMIRYDRQVMRAALGYAPSHAILTPANRRRRDNQTFIRHVTHHPSAPMKWERYQSTLAATVHTIRPNQCQTWLSMNARSLRFRVLPWIANKPGGESLGLPRVISSKGAIP